MKLPTFINPHSGSAAQCVEALEQDHRLQLFALHPQEMADGIRRQVAAGATRIAVCGGDGTLALAAGIVLEQEVEMAVLPGGTLNHFARRIGIPTDLPRAVDLAVTGQAGGVDVGMVNECLFLNTSSVGAYVRFVRTRNHLERKMTYSLASFYAGVRRLVRLRSAHIHLDEQTLRTPLVFVGVGEREIAFPFLGSERKEGAKGLHLIALRSKNRLDTVKIALNAMLRGVDPLQKTRALEARMVERIDLDYHRTKKGVYVATDGELNLLQPPLRYQYCAQRLSVVHPAAAVSS